MNSKRLTRLVVSLVILLTSAGYSAWQQGYFSGNVASDGSVKVVQVVDGDTIKVNVRGTTETVRFLGINTPETVDPRKPVQCFGKQASAKMHALLEDAQVKLEAAQGREDRDMYGRLLRYVRLQDGTDVNLMMITEGLAHEYTYGSPHPRAVEYKEAEAKAKADKRGLWSSAACAAESAHTTKKR